MTELWARLVHDVAKYVARTARNVPDGVWDAELGAMLCVDLYGGERISQRFARLAAAIEAVRGPQPAFVELRARFAEVDALEADVRAGDRHALAHAARIALCIEDEIRTLARAHRESS